MTEKLDMIMINLVKAVCKEADKLEWDRDSTLRNFAEVLIELTELGTFKNFEIK